MNAKKKDAAVILQKLAALRASTWLGPARQWWPDFLFHFTDISNAVKILESGKLVCRSRVNIEKDIASQQVIEQTDEKWKDYVRLYFRPRTPTQYHNEGFRPISSLSSLKAHCPMPIFLVFDADTLLTADSTYFSDGNVAVSKPSVGNDASFFQTIPFEKVFHDGRLNDNEKRNIVYHRHAEVLIPNELGLDSLKWIVCRSEAESRTLRELLNLKTWLKIHKRVKKSPQLFFQYWTFVVATELEQNKVTVRFNASSRTPASFAVRLDIKNLQTGENYFWKNDAFTANSDLRVRIPQLTTPCSYQVRLTLDDAIAYADTFVSEPMF